MGLSFPKINGHQFSHSSVEIHISSKTSTTILSQFSEFKYSHSLEPGIVKGQRAEAFGRTRGEYTAEGSLTSIMAIYQELIKGLGSGYMEKSFDITATWTEEGADQVTVKAFGCRLKKSDFSSSSGGDPNNVTYDLSIMRIEESGLTPIKNMLR